MCDNDIYININKKFKKRIKKIKIKRNKEYNKKYKKYNNKIYKCLDEIRPHFKNMTNFLLYGFEKYHNINILQTIAISDLFDNEKQKLVTIIINKCHLKNP